MSRLEYALTHPITNPDPAVLDMRPYQRVEVQRDGNLLMTVLAVDR